MRKMTNEATPKKMKKKEKKSWNSSASYTGKASESTSARRTWSGSEKAAKNASGKGMEKRPWERLEKRQGKRTWNIPEEETEKEENPRTGENPGNRKKTNAEKKLQAGRKQSNTAKNSGSGRIQNADICPVYKKCGGCQYQGVSYEEQLARKQTAMRKLLGSYGKVQPIIGMENPLYYRNKVHHVFAGDRRGGIISGTYEENSHRVVPVQHCRIEDEACQKIMQTLERLLVSFKIRPYNEDTGFGFFRHALIRRGFQSGEILVVLVTASPVFPSRSNFVKALRAEHPEITSIVMNINDRHTSMVLGEREQVLYGPGYIKDTLCGISYRISPKSFYQVNPVQTEILYQTAIRYAGLTGTEKVIDAYCGIGTIGLTAAGSAGQVIGAELNPDAVKDAKINAKMNGIRNAVFIQKDAGRFMAELAANGESADVVFMDPPRSGSDERFLRSLCRLAPKRVVYISCGPETLARDLKYLVKNGYQVTRIQPVDMFPFTEHCEVVSCLVLG